MPNSSAPVAALRRSHDRLAGLAAGLDPAAAGRMSYCSDWTIAQVYSHLGSGAEIGLSWLDSAVRHTDTMGQDGMQAIWDVWNARPPFEQVTEAVKADARLVETYEALTDDDLAKAHLKLFGMIDVDGSGMALFRLPEHTVHTWDVAVALDPAARVAPDAVALLIGELPSRMGWLAKPQGGTWSLAVETTDPARTFTLRNTGEAVTVADDAGADPDGTLRLTSEAFLRLVYGRLDADKADGAETTGTVTLDELRATFPGL